MAESSPKPLPRPPGQEPPGLQPVRSFQMESIRRPQDERRSNTRRSWILLAIGISFTVLLAVLGIFIDLDAWGAAGLTLVAGIFQVLSVFVANRTGPAEQTVRHQLFSALRMYHRLDDLRQRTEAAYETGTAELRRKHLGVVSAEFVYLQDNAEANFHGWASIYPDLLNSPEIAEPPHKESYGDD